MNPTDAGEGFFLVLWVIVGFVVLGVALAYFSYRNRSIEKKRDERRRAGLDDRQERA